MVLGEEILEEFAMAAELGARYYGGNYEYQKDFEQFFMFVDFPRNPKADLDDGAKFLDADESTRESMRRAPRVITKTTVPTKLSANGVLTIEDARHIREMHDKGRFSCREIARLYGVSRATVDRIVDNRTYREDRVRVGAAERVVKGWIRPVKKPKKDPALVEGLLSRLPKFDAYQRRPGQAKDGQFKPSDVQYIREIYASGWVSKAKIAARCGVSHKAICNLLSGKTYQTVKEIVAA